MYPAPLPVTEQSPVLSVWVCTLALNGGEGSSGSSQQGLQAEPGVGVQEEAHCPSMWKRSSHKAEQGLRQAA